MFFDNLKIFKCIDTQKIIIDIDNALSNFIEYSTNFDAVKPNLSNDLQHNLLKDNEILLHDFLLLKKELEEVTGTMRNCLK